VVVDSLKALDPKWPIREADSSRTSSHCPLGASFRKQCCGTRQNYPDFGELAWLRFDLD
jgi:hypothetical protein